MLLTKNMAIVFYFDAYQSVQNELSVGVDHSLIYVTADYIMCIFYTTRTSNASPCCFVYISVLYDLCRTVEGE